MAVERDAMRYLIAAAVLGLAGSAMADNFFELAKLVPSDGMANDQFGAKVSASGEYVLIGAHRDDDNGESSGSAYVYWPNSTGTWIRFKLVPADGGAGHFFGSDVSIDGNIALVGARNDHTKTAFSGSAYLFERQSSGVWTQLQNLYPSDAEVEDNFGYSVALSGDICVIGATSWAGQAGKAAYVYERQPNGLWEESARLQPEGLSGDGFGSSVATDGESIVVGVPYDDDLGTNSGSAFVYSQSESGDWAQVAKLLGSGIGSDHHFGRNVEVDGETIMVSGNQGNYGHVYVFERSGSSDWAEVQAIADPHGPSGHAFGGAVALEGDVAVIGSYLDSGVDQFTGTARVYVHELGQWTYRHFLRASDGSSRFGAAVDISGETVVIGAYGDDDNGTDSGSAYIFDAGVESDADGDGVPDDEDNCNLYNPDQADCNENAIGDVCDIADETSLDVDGSGVPDECECLADQSLDGEVNVNDILIVIATWGTNGSLGDVNYDGIVDTNDILAVISAWGPCP